MAEVGGSGAKPFGGEPGKPTPIASLERALEQVVDFLGRADQTSRVRALAIEARRLRTVVGKWRSIEPPEDVREEMIARVLRLANDAEEAAAETRAQTGAKAAQAPALPGPAAPAMALPAASPSAPALPAAAPSRPVTPSGARLPAVPDLGARVEGARERGAPTHIEGTRERGAPTHIEGTRERGAPTHIEDEPTIADEPRFEEAPARQAVAVPDLAIERPNRAAQAPHPRLPSLQFMPVVHEAPAAEAPAPNLAQAGSTDLVLREPDALAQTLRLDDGPVLAQPSWGEGPPSLVIDPADAAPASLDAATMTFTLPTGISALHAISVFPAKRPQGLDPYLVMITDPYSKQADAYRALRRKLLAGTARTIAVTSARPREGKTTCAVNLALALAEASPKNVLVVEANIRSPALAAMLKFEPPVCFTEQLRRHRKEDSEDPWVVVDQGSDGNEQSEGGGRPSLQGGAVHLLAVDPRSERPPMLDAVAFPRGMEALKRAGYEYVIIDTPAVLGALDMQIIGDTVDGVIFTSIAKRSKRASLRQAIEKIKPAPVLGVIVLEG